MGKLFGTPPPHKVKFVSNTNDPAYQKYNDSLNLYNDYVYQRYNMPAAADEYLKDWGKDYPGGATQLKADRAANVPATGSIVRYGQKEDGFNLINGPDKTVPYNKSLYSPRYTYRHKSQNFTNTVNNPNYLDPPGAIDNQIINYYKSKKYSEPVAIGNYTSPDIYHKTIKPVGDYFDGIAESPIYMKPKIPVFVEGTDIANVAKQQQFLKDAGYDPGPIDGIMGDKTKNAQSLYDNTQNNQIPKVSQIMQKANPEVNPSKKNQQDFKVYNNGTISIMGISNPKEIIQFIGSNDPRYIKMQELYNNGTISSPFEFKEWEKNNKTLE